MDNEFGEFVTIERVGLKRAIAQIPDQNTTWGCGLHQVGHAMVCAGYPCDINFEERGDYPLSVDINTKAERVKQILSNPLVAGFAKSMKCDEEGNFRVGATPWDMQQFLSKCLVDCAVKPRVTSLPKIEKDCLMQIVEKSIEKNMPVLAYYVVDSSQLTMHVYSIVGYSDDQLLLLNTRGSGAERLGTKNIYEFIEKLDASKITKIVRMIDAVGALVGLREMIESDGGKVASPTSISAWNSYSLIGFVDSDEPDEPTEQIKPAAECSIQ